MRKRDQKKQKRRFREDWKMICRAIGIWWEISPRVLLYRCASMILYTAAPYFPLYLSALLVNELSGECDFRRLLYLAAAAALGQFGISFITRFVDGKNRICTGDAGQQMELYLMQRQNRMQYEHMENSDVTLLREEINAYGNASGAGMMKIIWEFPNVVKEIMNMGISITVTLSMFRLAANAELTGFLGFVNSPFLVILVVPMLFLTAMLSAKIEAARTAAEVRELKGLAETNTLYFALEDIFGVDVAVFDLKKAVLEEWKKMLRPRWEEECRKINTRYRCLNCLLKAVLDMAVFLITAAKAFTGVFGIGNFLLYKGALDRFTESVSHIMGSITALRENNKYLQMFFDYIDMPDDMYKGTLAVEKRDDIDYEIEFRNVSFRYPGTESWVLRNVNVRFRIGDKMAIVGENGSGKTTFIKLLCRLYDPTEGEILLNRINISRYRYEEYISLFSVVFQDYRLFQFSLAANVACSFSYREEDVENCLIQAGLGEKLRSLDRGVETVVGRDYEDDGVDMSGGEQQKIALARALYKNAPFIVLDEPTAALDPIAEAAVYEGFRELAKDKTAVFISHRLSSCRFCDDIIVFEAGRVVQRGSHDKLCGAGGKYAQMWNAQAKYYKDKDDIDSGHATA